MTKITPDGKFSVSLAGGQSNELLYTNRNAPSERQGDADYSSNESGLICLWRDGVPLSPAETDKRRLELALKRAFDLIVALLLILFLLPLLIVLAALIKLTSRGPVLFRQTRIGHLGTAFDIPKFRSMTVGKGDPSGADPSHVSPPRVTLIGRFLRRHSLDELPQLFCVVRGEMSLVGPRPHIAGQLASGRPYQEVVPYYPLRHQMKPGLTGWAQVNGFRGSTDDAASARSRIDHDMAYIQNFSLALDIVIVVRTAIRELLSGTGV